MDTTHYAIFPSPLGEIIATANDLALTGLWFYDTYLNSFPADRLAGTEPSADHPVLKATAEWLAVYFSGEDPALPVPISLIGSPFQLAVWSLLQEIPYGETTTYGTIAALLQAQEGRLRPPAAQAVGGAVGKNPISLIVPCHRVLGARGLLTGYGGGLSRKAALLRLERATYRS
ncbi:MAG: methylated-DNA--[protein]-cysteine S-methyltransferase [Coriobacteriia bacterium]|nr:methylated-DNA--[protein]-cysteine S-methyltransferase [Coriobacteriia bacterium]